MSGILRRKRLPDGTFGDLEKIGEGDTQEEKFARLEAQNTNLMLALTDLYEYVFSVGEVSE